MLRFVVQNRMIVTIARAYFEIYKSLPVSVKSTVFSLIIKDESPLLSEIENSLIEVQQMKKGLKPKRNVKDLIASLRNKITLNNLSPCHPIIHRQPHFRCMANGYL